jgi:hypothetical protein
VRRRVKGYALIFAACALPLVGVVPVPAGASPYPVGYRPRAGETVVNPVIDCDADPVAGVGDVVGIVIERPSVTIVNPQIRECDRGIVVRKDGEVMPTGVRIIASADHPGYTDTNFTLNRSAITWRAGNGEVGDVSAPSNQIGGEMYFEDDYRYFSGTLTTDFRMHHTSSTCIIPCPTFANADAPGAHWALKFIANRRLGTPFEASNARFDHNLVRGFDDEGISFDPRGNTPSMRLGYAAGRVTGRSARRDTVSLSGVPTTERTVGMFVIFNEGSAKGSSLRIVSRSGNVFGVADPEDTLAKVPAGTRVTVGGRYFRNRVDHNVIDAFHATAAKSGFNTAGQLYSRISANVIYDTPDFRYPDAFHLRSNHQCIIIRSTAGPGGVPTFSFFNLVIRNRCDSAGDISAVVVSWGAYEVRSPTCIRFNTFSGSPLGGVWRHKAPEPRGGPHRCGQRAAA